MKLTARVALITGGKRIGAVIARRFAEAGADVALVYHRSHDAAEDTASAVRALGRRALTLHADLSIPARVVRATVQDLGPAGRIRLRLRTCLPPRRVDDAFVQ